MAPGGAEDCSGPARGPIRVAGGDASDRARIADLAARAKLTVHAYGSTVDLVDDGIGCGAVILILEEGLKEFGALSALRDRAPDVPIIVICAAADMRRARGVVEAGAAGVVFADRLETAFAPTLSAVLAGQSVVPRELAGRAAKPVLSAREKQILGMVVMGLTNRDISARLFLAESTVKSHLSSAFSKLGVRSRNQAAAKILDPQGALGVGILAITQAAPGPERPLDLEQPGILKSAPRE